MNKRNLKTLKRKKKNKRLRFIILLFIFFVFASSGAYFFVKHNILVDELVFVGNQHLKNDELVSLIGVSKGDELFNVSSREIYSRLKVSPWIKDAVIRKEFSGITVGRISINVTEAVPVAILSMAERTYLIDSDGTILEQMDEGTALFLPTIEEISPLKNKDAYKEALNFLSALRDKEVLSYGGDVKITGQRPEDLTLIIRGKAGSISIKIGAGDFNEKLKRFQLIRDEIEKRDISVQYIDIRFDNKVIVMPHGSKEEEKLHKQQG